MRVLITGMAGFAGLHLAECLLAETDWQITGLTRRPAPSLPALVEPRISWRVLELLERDAVHAVVGEVRPDVVVHLASQAHVPTSWENPWGTYESNLRGQLHIIDAVISHKLSPRLISVTSNEVYGAVDASALPIRESSTFAPNNPYAVSKVAQDYMARQYALSHSLDIVVARPFNHFGPRQDTRFVIPRFAEQIAEIELGLREPRMLLGNMAAQRDFTDVRDVAKAYLALIRNGHSGVAYNICSGEPRSIQYVLDKLIELAGVRVEQVSDPSKFRQVDTPISFGDASLNHEHTGWRPQIPFEQSLRDVLDLARAATRQKHNKH
jgi:GDP-4-dehydro-6-deoxy-D-mannose reductase